MKRKVTTFFLLDEYGLDILSLGKSGNDFLIENLSAVYDRFSPLYWDDLSRILIHEVLNPGLEHLGCKLASLELREVLSICLHLVSKSVDIDYILVTAISDSAQKSSDREFFLSVNVGEHDIVDVSCKLDP